METVKEGKAFFFKPVTCDNCKYKFICYTHNTTGCMLKVARIVEGYPRCSPYLMSLGAPDNAIVAYIIVNDLLDLVIRDQKGYLVRYETGQKDQKGYGFSQEES